MLISKQEIGVLIDKYKRQDFSYSEIKNRLNYLKFELKQNHSKKEQLDIDEIFKSKFKELQ